MCLWLSLQGTGPITCTGEPGNGLHPALNRRVLIGWEPQAHLPAGGTLEVGTKATEEVHSHVGELGGCGPIHKHRGALSLGDKEA